MLRKETRRERWRVISTEGEDKSEKTRKQNKLIPDQIQI